jgi:hypothetical protein
MGTVQTSSSLESVRRYAETVKKDIGLANSLGFQSSDDLKEAWRMFREATASADFDGAQRLLSRARALTWAPVTQHIQTELAKLKAQLANEYLDQVAGLVEEIDRLLKEKNTNLAWQKTQEAIRIFADASQEELDAARQCALERALANFGEI